MFSAGILWKAELGEKLKWVLVGNLGRCINCVLRFGTWSVHVLRVVRTTWLRPTRAPGNDCRRQWTHIMRNSFAESLLHFFYIVSFTLWTSAWRPCVCWHGSNILPLVIIDAHCVTPVELKFISRAILRRSSLENRLSDTRHSVHAQACT